MEACKRWIRVFDALLSCRISKSHFWDHQIFSFQPFFWPESSQSWFDQEIHPYFLEGFWNKKYEAIIDAGAAQGLFTIAARKIQPQASFFAFEPSLRQRILMNKNLWINGVFRGVRILPFGLWNVSQDLAFRTHGALSSLKETNQLPEGFFYQETIRGIRLDDFFGKTISRGPTLLKMDIEGAELEAVEGAKEWLSLARPDLLIQAYHLRDGRRTLERIQSVLRGLGFEVGESRRTPGLLVARGG